MMGDEHHRLAHPIQGPQHVEDGQRATPVLAGGRLVEDQDLRFERQHGGDDDAQPVAAAERHRMLVGGPGKIHRRQRAADGGIDIALGPLHHRQREADFLGHRVTEDLGMRVLRDIADALRKLAHLERRDIFAGDAHRARGWRKQMQEMPHQRGFAAAVAADNAEELAIGDRQIDAAQRLRAIGIDVGQPLDRQRDPGLGDIAPRLHWGGGRQRDSQRICLDGRFGRTERHRQGGRFAAARCTGVCGITDEHLEAAHDVGRPHAMLGQHLRSRQRPFRAALRPLPCRRRCSRTRLAISASSSLAWLAMTTVRPFSRFNFSRMAKTSADATGSSCEVGSSSTMMSDDSASADGNRQPLLLAARQIRRMPGLLPGETHRLQRLADAPGDFGRRHFEVLQREGHLARPPWSR